MEKEKKLEILGVLLNEGRSFTYENFSSKGKYGYPKAYTEEYTSWYIRTEEALKNFFGESSSVFRNFEKSKKVSVLGNESSKFDRAIGYVLAALKTSIDLLNFELPQRELTKPEVLNNKVFIVHGHDDSLKNELESFLKELGLEPIILHKQPDKGNTIIEKIEENSDVGFAIVLLTPDDVGYSSKEELKEESQKIKNSRARQNVILELGYFVGKLGREKVCCIHKKSIELPTDVSGLLYKPLNEKLDEVKWEIVRELKAAGYIIN